MPTAVSFDCENVHSGYIRVYVLEYSVVGPKFNWTFVSRVALMKELSPALELVVFHTVSIPTSLSIFVFASVTAAVQGNLQALGTHTCQCHPCSCVHSDPQKGFPGCERQQAAGTEC